MRDRPQADGLDGVLVLAKPPGPTSHDVVALVRRLTRARRVGHGGTLDPFAAGVLPVFLGRATRLAEFHLGAPKRYRATVCFGAASSTDDLEGELTPAEARAPAREAVERALRATLGTFRQRPPAYSARKIGGRRAYALARRGIEPALEPREVTIDALDLLEWDTSDPARPIAVIDVRCSAGTYVRALARDLGAAVGSAAYLGALTRTASGPFELADALPLDTLRAAANEGAPAIRRLLRPLDAGLERLPAVVLADAEVQAAARGQLVRPRAIRPGEAGQGGEPVRLLDRTGRLVAIGRWRGPSLVPDKVLVDLGRPRGPLPGVSPEAPAGSTAAGDGSHVVGDGPAPEPSDGPPPEPSHGPPPEAGDG